MKLTREEVLKLAQEAGLVTKIYDGGEFFELTDAQVASPILMKFAALLSVHLAKPLAESAVAPGECGSVPDEQAAFEVWFGRNGTMVGKMGRDSDGEYTHAVCRGAWAGWQARAALGMQPPNNQPNSDHVAVQLAEGAVASHEGGDVRDAAMAFVKKLDAIHADPVYQSVWFMSANRGAPYTGPQYIEELNSLKAALQSGISSPEQPPQNCREVGPGKGLCDQCAAGHYERCRYVAAVQTEQPGLSDADIWHYAEKLAADCQPNRIVFAKADLHAFARALLAQRQDSDTPNFGAIVDAWSQVPNDIKSELQHLGKLIMQFSAAIANGENKCNSK